MLQHYPDGEREYVCSACGRALVTERELRRGREWLESLMKGSQGPRLRGGTR